ncbi:toxin-antitoxin system, antitoxin component [Capnocytophaga sp.]|uniref:toxin-antitoxin system, antitoxin component n=1 Tax=Capnocytophaga sp. TaxID=44737 RepID=UPI0026DB5753|nr:toxin-antitoxin system, antitoxin component [Capnocytophaga sp.]MDO5105838.1 toxin-antitoxin system, antitoxin component [Capnocytophaga sp.]
MNAIPLKRNLSFREYQLAVKALEDIGIEVAEPQSVSEITEEDVRCIELARQDIKEKKLKNNEQVFQEAK